MLDEIYSDVKSHMEKCLEALKRDYSTVRTGKVHTSILDNISVNYYGTPTPLSQVATILTPDATTITITPWEKNMVGAIEKAINEANIGVNPNNNGEAVQLFFPPMTQDQRKNSVKQAKGMTDNAKVAIRNVRQNGNNKIKKLEKDKEITQDDSKHAQDEVQKMTDAYVIKTDEMFKTKENEIMTI